MSGTSIIAKFSMSLKAYQTMDFYLVEKLINYFALGLMDSYHKNSYKIFIFQFIFKALISF